MVNFFLLRVVIFWQIIDELLDVNKHPRKPQYSMASELPLNLFDCEFADDMEWIYEAGKKNHYYERQFLWHSNMTSFIGCMNNAMIKFTIYFTLHMRIVKQIMENISPIIFTRITLTTMENGNFTSCSRGLYQTC
jgi:hypothetical protein